MNLILKNISKQCFNMLMNIINIMLRKKKSGGSQPCVQPACPLLSLGFCVLAESFDIQSLRKVERDIQGVMMENVDKSRVDVHPTRVLKNKKAASRYKEAEEAF